jgi:predicted secreted protein
MKKITLLITLIFILLSACGRNDKSTLKVSDPQQAIVVDAGGEFTVVLEANPTTGYRWNIAGDLEQGMVKLVKNEYVSTSDPSMVGGGGLDVWTFKALRQGETQVTLGYYPPSNDPTDPQQTTTFTVTVK